MTKGKPFQVGMQFGNIKKLLAKELTREEAVAREVIMVKVGNLPKK